MTTNRCEHCGSVFESPQVRRWCSDKCRVADHHAKRREAVRLLVEQTEALASGADPAVIAEITRRAQRHLSA